MFYFLPRLLPAFVLFLVCTAAQPPMTASLNGTIFDEYRKPMMGVTVLLKHLPTGTYRGAITRSDGQYALTKLRTGGPYSVTLAFTGYKGQSKDSLMLEDGQKLSLDFNMQRSENGRR